MPLKAARSGSTAFCTGARRGARWQTSGRRRHARAPDPILDRICHRLDSRATFKIQIHPEVFAMNNWRQRFLVFALISLSACNEGRDLEDLNKGQKEILARLDNLDKLAQRLKAAPAAAGAARPDPNRIASLPLSDAPLRGPRSAKVTIAECSDFQCPFCGQATGVVEQVLKAYPKDVNFAYKQFPLPATMHPDAMSAAKAAVAAGKQGKFWEM